MNFVHFSNELPQEVLAKMLHSIKSNALQRNLLAQPKPPINHIILHFLVRIIKICKHQVIIVTLLAINVIRVSPAFGVVTEDLIDGGLVVVGVVVGSGEVIPVVFLTGVFVAAAGEVETKPGVDFVGVGDVLGAVFGVDFLGATFLFMVCCCFVVEDCMNAKSVARSCSWMLKKL